MHPRSRRIQTLLALRRHELNVTGVAENELRDAAAEFGLEPLVPGRLRLTQSLRRARAKRTQTTHARMDSDAQLAAAADAFDRAVHLRHGFLFASTAPGAGCLSFFLASDMRDRLSIEGVRNVGMFAAQVADRAIHDVEQLSLIHI